MSDYFPPAPTSPEPNVLERIGQGMAEGVCDAVTSPATIIKGLARADFREVADGVLKAAGGAEIVVSPWSYAGRTTFRETIGNKLQDKVYDLAEEKGIQIPAALRQRGYDCLSENFNRAHDDNLQKLMESSPQVRRALERGGPGLY